MFKPNDSFKSKWDIIVILGAFFNCFSIPFKVAYKPEYMDSTPFFVFNLCIDFVFLIDIFITFRTSYFDDYGQEIDSPLEIAKNYLKGQFCIDLLAFLPLDVIIVYLFLDE